MKKLLLLIGLICCIGSVSAQTKTAYCDVYMRGGYDCMTVTIMYDSNSHRLNRSYSMGEILNIMAEDGWVLDNDIVIPRHPFYSFFTRHKLHLIMKKEYNTGENPFGYIETFCNKKTDPKEIKKHNANYVEKSISHQEIKKEDITTNGINTKIDNLSSNLGKHVEYNSVNGIIINAQEKQYIIAAAEGQYGTWDEAVAYCLKLGGEWHLPSSVELKSLHSQLPNNFYWTNKNVNSNTAKFYNWSAGKTYESNKNRILYILPIAIVDAESVEFK